MLSWSWLLGRVPGSAAGSGPPRGGVCESLQALWGMHGAALVCGSVTVELLLSGLQVGWEGGLCWGWPALWGLLGVCMRELQGPNAKRWTFLQKQQYASEAGSQVASLTAGL